MFSLRVLLVLVEIGLKYCANQKNSQCVFLQCFLLFLKKLYTYRKKWWNPIKNRLCTTNKNILNVFQVACRPWVLAVEHTVYELPNLAFEQWHEITCLAACWYPPVCAVDFEQTQLSVRGKGIYAMNGTPHAYIVFRLTYQNSNNTSFWCIVKYLKKCGISYIIISRALSSIKQCN